jgi:hypothetical protein
MTALHMTARHVKALKRNLVREDKPRPVKHLVRRTSSEIGGATRYHAACGYTALTRLSFSPELTKTSCPLCLTAEQTKGRSKPQKAEKEETK